MAAEDKKQADKSEEIDDEYELEEEYEEESRGTKLLKIAIVLFLLLVFIVGGFVAGLYLRIFDMDQVNEKMGLYKYPILSEYFEKPLSVIKAEEEAALQKAIEEAQAQEAANKADKSKAPAADKSDEASADPAVKTDADGKKVLSKEEIEKQVKQRQAESKKRISKLARLYENMKPDDAANLLEDLDDDMIVDILGKMDESQVSKVLTKMSNERGARITRIMYNGKPPVTNIK